MSFFQKMDVLDLIIETLREHERVLDDLAYRLEACLNENPAGKTLTPEKGAELKSWR